MPLSHAHPTTTTNTRLTVPVPTRSLPFGEDAPDVETLLSRLSETDDADERARLTDDVVKATIHLADGIALRYAGRGIDTDDLVQVARTALVAAVGRYRPSVGRPFVAFAVPTIRGELKRHFRDAGWAVRPPRGLQELRAEVLSAEEDLRHRLGRDATLDELAAFVGRPTVDVRAARACGSAFAPSSLDAPTALGDPLGSLLPSDHDEAAEIALRAAVQAELGRLTPRERLVLRLRFEDERTQREIGEVVGVSQMQVSRVLTSVLARLRERLDPATAA